jgi:D-alanyl-D-alanine carboxypeptidase
MSSCRTGIRETVVALSVPARRVADADLGMTGLSMITRWIDPRSTILLAFTRSWLEFRYGEEDITGFSVAVAHRGQLLLSDAFGYADVAKATKLTTSHIFRIASHSKTFTATALMQLQEKGALRIDDHVADYLPWLGAHRDRRWRQVTVRQLMSHGAGIIRDGLDADYWQLEHEFPDEAELKQGILNTELVLDPNSKLKYSNYGYGLLGLLVGVISKQPYNEYVNEHIVRALDLEHTGPEYTPAIQSDLAIGYSRRAADKSRLPIADVDTRALAAATGFYATAEDLCTYFSAHIVGSKRLLSDESKREMQRVHYHAHTPGEEGEADCGLGLQLSALDHRHTFGHSGGFPGYITTSMVDPEDELVVVVLTNCDGPAGDIARGIFSIVGYYQKNTSTTTELEDDLGHLEGRFMNLWEVKDIVVTGNKVVASPSVTWQPLKHPEELAFVGENTFRVTGTSSFAAEGELVHFNVNNGVVETVTYNGTTMWPEEAWVNKQSSRTVVRPATAANAINAT